VNPSFVRLRRPPIVRKPWLTRRRVTLAVCVLLLLLLGLAAYALAPDRQLAKVKQMRAELTGEAGRSLSPEQRRQKWEQLRRESEKLSPAQRNELGREQRERFQAEMNRFFKMSKKEQNAYLDSQIDRMEAFRKRMAQQGGARPGQFAGGGAFMASRSSGNPEDREQRRRQRLDNSTPEQRAQMDLFRKMMNQRRSERGFPVSGRP
jgi:hypothetical protein